jgi:hypothetical protein
VELARTNLAALGNPPDRVSAARFWWGTPLDEVPELRGRAWDFVLATDVAYTDEVLDPLVDALCAVCGPGTTALLCNGSRSWRRERRLRAALRKHFDVVELEAPDRSLPSPPLSPPRHLCRRRPCHLPPTPRRQLEPPRRALLRSAHGGRARAARADQGPHVCHGGRAAAAGGRQGRQRGRSGAGARHTAGDAPLHASVASNAQGAVARRRTARARARAKCCARKCAPGLVAARRLCVPSHIAP